MTRLTKPFRRIGTSPATRYGPDRDRPFVVTLAPSTDGDTISLKPLGRRTGSVVVLLSTVYAWALQAQANRVQLERARAKAAKKRERLERARWRREISKPVDQL